MSWGGSCSSTPTTLLGLHSPSQNRLKPQCETDAGQSAANELGTVARAEVSLPRYVQASTLERAQEEPGSTRQEAREAFLRRSTLEERLPRPQQCLRHAIKQEMMKRLELVSGAGNPLRSFYQARRAETLSPIRIERAAAQIESGWLGGATP